MAFDLNVEIRWITRLGIFSGLIYLGAQTYQYVSPWLWPPATGSVLGAIEDRTTLHDRVRCVAILASFLLIPSYYLAIGWYLGRRRPAAAALGVVFSLMFVCMEILHRAIDCFVVSGRWAAAVATSIGEAREALLANIRNWDAMTNAIYLPLLAAHLMASVAFLRATMMLEHPWNVILSAVLMMNCVRLAARLAELAANASWLGSWNAAVYFPATVLLFGAFSLWLLAELKRTGQATVHVADGRREP
jgi:hypothetical protein